MIIKKVVDIQMDHNTIKILCECDNNKYQVMEAQINLNGIEINLEIDEIGINGSKSIIEDKCNIIIPVKKDGDIYFSFREWK